MTRLGCPGLASAEARRRFAVATGADVGYQLCWRQQPGYQRPIRNQPSSSSATSPHHLTSRPSAPLDVAAHQEQCAFVCKTAEIGSKRFEQCRQGRYVTYSFQTMYQGSDPAPLIDNVQMFKELSGASEMQVIQQIAAGDLTGVCLAVSTWESVQAGWDGLSALYADPKVQAISTTGTMTVAGRSVSKVRHQHGTCSGNYVGWTSFTGEIPNESEFSNITAIADTHGINGLRMSQAIAAGANSNARLAAFYCDSLNNWADMMDDLTSDPGFLLTVARTGFVPVRRGLALVH
jgi:hypothetical protein